VAGSMIESLDGRVPAISINGAEIGGRLGSRVEVG
jgi:hypothetical protein